MLVGERVWSLVGPLPAKDKTQLEERLRRVSGPSVPEKLDATATPPAISRFTTLSGAIPRLGAPPRAGSPSASAVSRLGRPASPARTGRSNSPTSPGVPRSDSPVRVSGLPGNPQLGMPSSTRPRSLLPSRLGRPRTNTFQTSALAATHEGAVINDPHSQDDFESNPSNDVKNFEHDAAPPEVPDDITITISSILSNDPSRSVDALKKIQKVLAIGQDAGRSSSQYRELAEHTEGLIETVTLQMAHVFERPDDLIPDENFRLAKHLIQTLNNFCDHTLLAESLTVDLLTSLLEELTLRLLETDDSPVKKVKDLSRFINMIILRLFATGRRMSIFRWVIMMSSW